jgi:hypothetical protein
MNIETDDWVTMPEAAKVLGLTTSRVHQMANQGGLEVIQPWPRVRLVARRSVTERLGRNTAIRLSRGTAVRWIAARHGVPGHPVRSDRITAAMNRVIAGLKPKALRSEVYRFVTEARPQWSESRRTAYVVDLVSQIEPPARS